MLKVRLVLFIARFVILAVAIVGLATIHLMPPIWVWIWSRAMIVLVCAYLGSWLATVVIRGIYAKGS